MIKIDIEQVLRTKAPKLHLPKFVVRYLKRIIHQDEMNNFLATHGEERDYEFIDHVVHDLLQCDATVEGVENIPQTTNPLIFVSNHPLGGLDGMICAMLLHQNRSHELKVIVTDFLMYVTPLAGLFVPVNKVGAQSREYLRRLNEMWESEVDVLSFPSGKCARKQNGKITEQPWAKSIIQKAVQYKRDIVPMHFEGANSQFFYNLALWRTRLGIKTNLEMLYLVDEMFRSKGKHFHVRIGKPIPWQTFDKTRTPLQWAEWVRLYTLDI